MHPNNQGIELEIFLKKAVLFSIRAGSDDFTQNFLKLPKNREASLLL